MGFGNILYHSGSVCVYNFSDCKIINNFHREMCIANSARDIYNHAPKSSFINYFAPLHLKRSIIKMFLIGAYPQTEVLIMK